ncbi:MAG: tRNA (adenosine(37)-N6)-threonylcarbamoyltransferase complex ATPase subunit type 1 TsaE [Cephaloticoccus sp.]|nr:tRNA (adenosine(37)-N6)-threonylcarbamoyltransferase complex ATPase subunit type 1 TsaE [Cephaloticoccus sp.]MCF7761052.1 tRNA (adenosine(37)-N6)-threonylcarbamoyltransferase complex ATPase subunit type 1 TsaE [Cephaloticoccus sp.]
MASSIYTRLRGGIATASARETEAIAIEFAATLPGDVTLALHGDLGVGKTTFVRGLARGLGIKGPVTSPTFSIYTMHRGDRTLVHLDAYRLETPQQVDDLLLEDFLISPYVLAIEWPEKIAAWIPADALHLELNIAPDERHTIRLR